MKDFYVVEYCSRQNSFHIETMAKALKLNIKTMMDGGKSEWIIVGVTKTSEEAAELIKKIIKKNPKLDKYATKKPNK